MYVESFDDRSDRFGKGKVAIDIVERMKAVGDFIDGFVLWSCELAVGVEGFILEEKADLVARIEEVICRRSASRIVEDRLRTITDVLVVAASRKASPRSLSANTEEGTKSVSPSGDPSDQSPPKAVLPSPAVSPPRRP